MIYLKTTLIITALVSISSLGAADEKAAFFDAYCKAQGTLIKKSVDSAGNPVAYMAHKEHDALTKVFWKNGGVAAECSSLSSAVEFRDDFYTLTGELNDIVTSKDPAIVGTKLHKLLTGIFAYDAASGILKCTGEVPVISDAEYMHLSENNAFDFASLQRSKKERGEDLPAWYNSGCFGTVIAWRFGFARFMSLLCKPVVVSAPDVQIKLDLPALHPLSVAVYVSVAETNPGLQALYDFYGAPKR